MATPVPPIMETPEKVDRAHEGRPMLGQVPTPVDVARYMARCLSAERTSKVLDPGAGEGALSIAVADLTRSDPPSKLTLVEVDEAITRLLSRAPSLAGAEIVTSDFIDWGIGQLEATRTWDRIIANPPYLNFHDFDRKIIDKVNVAVGTELNRLSNLFSAFLVLSSRLLAPGGRMVFISPTELFSTNYGKRTLGSLGPGVALRRVVIFDVDAEPFDQADTSACITVFERSESPETPSVEIQRVTSRDRVTGLWQMSPSRFLPEPKVRAHPKEVLWTGAVEGDLPPSALVPLGELFRVSRGIATGANSFFVLDSATRDEVDPEGRFTVPVVSRAQDLGQSLTFDDLTFRTLSHGGRRCWLLYLASGDRLPVSVAAYLAEGERQGVSTRYLCKARTPWWTSETQKPPIAFVPVFTRDGIRFVLNGVGARTLTCCHRVYERAGRASPSFAALLLACYFRSAEGKAAVAREYRHYGSGLLKLEPKDLENVLVPDLRLLSAEEGERLSVLARKTGTQARANASGWESIVKEMSKLLTGRGGAGRTHQAPLTSWSEA